MAKAASGSTSRISYIKETVLGETPAVTTTAKELERTSFDIQLNANEITDETVRADRQVQYARRGSVSVEGSVGQNITFGNSDDLIEAALMGTWTTDVLKVGTVSRSFSICESLYTETPTHHTYKGCTVNTMDFSITQDNLIAITFGFLGTSEGAFGPTPMAASPIVPTNSVRMYHAEGTIREDGVVVANMSDLSFQLTNNLNINRRLGSDAAHSISEGKCEVTGSFSAWFENATMYNKFVANTATSLELEMVDTLGNKYIVLLPRVQFTQVSLDRPDGAVSQNFTFKALKDSVTGTTIQFTRDPV